MPATETLVRDHIRSVVETEFSSEGFTVADDKLTRAAGMEGTALAVYPEDASENPKQVMELVVKATLQLYLAYSAEPDENIEVDPSVIEGYADRLRSAFQDDSSGGSGDFWYLRLTGIEFPDDPTGNKSRLEAHFQAYADNLASTP